MSYSLIDHRHRFALWASARASSRGGLGVTTESAHQWAEHLNFRNLLVGYDALPEAVKFDQQHRKWRKELIAFVGEKLTHGKAAKFINVYLKAALVCAYADENGQVPLVLQSRLGAIHPPIDRLLLKNIAKRDNTDDKLFFRSCHPWSELDEKKYDEIIARLKDIAQYQYPGATLELWRLEKCWKGY